jgi:glutathione-regulated potassium-efflux system ancillary protein KefF
MARTVVIAAHPHLAQSRVTARLMRRAALGGPDVDVRDLYALYPDYWIDRAAEQAALAAAGLVVWLHPVHWYGMPPLLKLWLDEVFTFGWAYGPGGRALAGKSLWLVASTGGPADSYRPGGSHHHAFADFLPPYTQTAALTGLCWREPLVLHGAHRADEALLAAFEDRFAFQLAALAADALPAPPAVDIGADERPDGA